MKRNVLIVIPNLGTGGAERLVIDIARFIDKDLFETTILCYYNNKPDAYYNLITNEGINVIYLDKRIGLDFSMFNKVRKIVKSIKPHIIHAHLDSLLYLIPSFNNKQRKIFTVHSIASFEADSFLQRTVRFFCFHLYKVIPIAISESLIIDIANTYLLKRNFVKCIPNGVDTTKFIAKEHIKKTDKVFTFINVGALKYQKNHEMLINAFSILLKDHKNTKLLILGDGILKVNILQQIEQLKLESSIELIGEVKNVEDYLLISDVFVNSSNVEGLALSILEAMSCGLPVIATDVGGTSDIIKNNFNGYLVEANNTNQLYELMKLMLNLTNEQRASLASKSQVILSKYSIQKCVKSYEEVYR